ncbi:hypothetical protein Taro_011108, partial [Colocasia esculenta]|nr:hypothetical protein [Colocasia esculenta]
MLAVASPDALLVSPWLGGHTPRSIASPWDYASPSPVPIRASGASKQTSASHNCRKSRQLTFSTAAFEITEVVESSFSTDCNHGIPEEMQQEMDYDADRAWYDREEHGTVSDGDSSSSFFGHDSSYQKKEAELAKRLARKDGTLMTLAQSKKLSHVTAANAQWEDRQLLRSGAVRGTELQMDFEDEDDRKWEDRQLLRSGAVRGTELQMDFEDEDERKVILHVHDTKPPFLDGSVVFTKQAEPVMPIKDPTSDMAIISRKGSALFREIREKQTMNKSRQRFWELAGSKLGDILGVEKTADQIDADTAVVGEAGEVDFKEDAKFSQHMKDGGEA